jgi:predicted Zn-dependent peptidase
MNAVLAITGHIDLEQRRGLSEKYFGWIPPGKRMERPSASLDRLPAPVARTANDPNGRHVIAYRTNKRGAEDEIAVEVAARVIVASLSKASSSTSDIHYEIVHSSSGGELRFVSSSSFSADDIAKAIASSLSDESVRNAARDLELDLLVALEGLAYRADALTEGADFERRLAALKTMNADLVRHAASYWLAPSGAVAVTGSPSRGGTP